jgi:aspartate/methionine/tyrosine aminotransferase
VLVASPSNPTGTSMTVPQARELLAAVRARGGFAIVDEIYQGLSYDDKPVSALALDDGVITVNSFSKYFSMTGWRLGWLVLPEALVAPVEMLAQHLFICASTVAQRAALACFEPESLAEYEARRAEFRQRRDWLVPALQDIGFKVPVLPDGAFYVWADASAFCDSSWDFAFELMEKAQVCVTPGKDFGHAGTGRFVRLSFANALPQLQEAVSRLRQLLVR